MGGRFRAALDALFTDDSVALHAESGHLLRTERDGWAGSAIVMPLELIVSDYRRRGRGRSNRGHCATYGCLRPTNDDWRNSTAHVAHASLKRQCSAWLL